VIAAALSKMLVFLYVWLSTVTGGGVPVTAAPHPAPPAPTVSVEPASAGDAAPAPVAAADPAVAGCDEKMGEVLQRLKVEQGYRMDLERRLAAALAGS
jgi:hypothetical protein